VEVLNVRNVHEALPLAMTMLQQRGVIQRSRNGDVVRMPTPVATVYAQPTERVEFHAWRNSNPFFHLYESLWMLAGRDDVAPLARYVPRMAEYSDDGDKFNAAYGKRWRAALRHPGVDYWPHTVDQLPIICDALRADPDTRQQALQIWDHRLDLGTQTKDHACNLTATFQVRQSHVEMVVFCRSNDVIWGALGANAAHFSMLHEYVARRSGYQVGTYTQISVNWHAYVSVFAPMLERMTDVTLNPYVDGVFLDPKTPVRPCPIAESGADFDEWDLECTRFVTADGTLPVVRSRVPFFRDVAWPVVQAHDFYKSGSIEGALASIEECAAQDWRLACRQWLTRRRLKMEQS
jgi:thymidylate synthase